MAKKGAKEIKEVTFFRSIHFRLILAFLVPVVGIVVLGAASYRNASEAIVQSYKDSTQQSINMLGQYMDLVVTGGKDEFKSYLNDGDLTAYFNGVAKDEVTTSKSFGDKVRGKAATDGKVKSIYFLADAGKSITSASTKPEKDAYSAYTATGQGSILAADKHNWYLFGADAAADDAVALETGNYSIRMAKMMSDAKAAMIVNIDAGFTHDTMQSLDPGEGGYVVLITSDGVEFYSDAEIAPEEPVVYGTEFYQAAIEAEEENGGSMVTINGAPYLFVYSKLSMGGAMVCSLISEETMTAQTASIKSLSLILTLIAAALAMLLGTMLARRMSGTINYILRQLGKVAKGDLTVHLTAKGQDEFGLLCNGINNTVEHVKDLIVNVNEVSGKLNEAAAYVNEASGTFMETSNDIQNVVSELEVGVNKLDTGSEDCLMQMDSLSGKISNVSMNAGEIGKLTTEAGGTISQGIRSVRGLTESAQSTTEITQNVIAAIEELEEKSNSIHKIIQEINDIAEQTNLLSLNASIEAARAGEAGRGFAVVAEEIRKLSDQCQESAGKISKIVTEIVEKTEDVVGIARQAESVVSSQTGAVEETTNSFKLIDRQVASLIEALDTISSNVEDMSNSRNETLEAIESISAVSAETAACSSSVHSTANTQLSAIKELEDASTELQNRADRLVEILGTFQV